jgi:hypothetical protein
LEKLEETGNIKENVEEKSAIKSNPNCTAPKKGHKYFEKSLIYSTYFV